MVKKLILSKIIFTIFFSLKNDNITLDLDPNWAKIPDPDPDPNSVYIFGTYLLGT